MKSKLLKLRKNQSTFPLELLEETELECLEIISDQLEVLPNNISKLKNLKILSLNTPGLISLPESLIDFQKLETLKIKNTTITNLGEIPFPSSLKVFICSNNKIETIPDWVFTLPNIEHLDFSGNEINNLSEKIILLPFLRRLVLDRNNIITITHKLKNCPCLTHLSLDGNPLSEESKKMLNEEFGIWF